ncbi:MAG: DUF1501 domain-containing protein [Cystobacterineae bacterium]|nr:DUF1501 domain-containing protein [Cystobacterineae bacterium]
MDRRTFLKAVGSFAVLLPWVGQKAFAQSPRYQGPFLLCINAGGGWDTTMFFDPKSAYINNNGVSTIVNRSYTQPETLGRFSYAPVPFEQSTTTGLVTLHSPQTFLTRHGNRLLVINGVDAQTNAHQVGEQIVWSGHIASAYPSIGALLAAKASQSLDLPCAYLVNNGGYTRTLGLVPLSQANTSNISSIAYEGYFRGATPSASTPEPNLFSPKTSQRIREANERRIAQLNQQLSMPASKKALKRYNEAVLTQNGLAPLAAQLSSLNTTIARLRPGAANTGSINTVLQQANLALCGFSVGTTVSASISFGGFDTHSTNDTNQQLRLGLLFVLIEHILNQAEVMGLSDQLYVVVGSEFARTPFYNAQNGKDHWNVTSLMAFGPQIQGGRVVGATKDNLYPDYVSRSDPSQRADPSNGIVLKPWHVHRELRRVLGLSGTPWDATYGLIDNDKPIPLF